MDAEITFRESNYIFSKLIYKIIKTNRFFKCCPPGLPLFVGWCGSGYGVIHLSYMVVENIFFLGNYGHGSGSFTSGGIEASGAGVIANGC